MNYMETVKMSVNSMLQNKLRSFLTILGIIISIITIIILQALIEGLNLSVRSQLANIGSNVFYVQKYPVVYTDESEFKNRKDITMSEIRAIEKKAQSVQFVTPEDFQFGVTVEYKGKDTGPTVFLIGGTHLWNLTNDMQIDEGRFFTEFEVNNSQKNCVIGVEIAEKLFPFRNAIGEAIIIRGVRFTVIGVFEERGIFWGQNRDNLVLVPISIFTKLYGENRSFRIAIKAGSAGLLNTSIDEVIGILRIERKVPFGSKNDFEIVTQSTLLNAWKNMIDILNIAGLVICFISLFVSGISVTNIMLITITERTKEIGIRKAVGAKRRDIMLQFLTEAVLMCETGGVAGIIFSFGIERLISSYTQLPVSIPVWVVFLSIMFVSLVGIFFGFFPADKAARLNTIDAIRRN
ncbi:MAG: ABC transporter permease [Spirochaetales bacterium]|nr:ABC transporter permease [Spirochaetales bacterium]